MKIYRSLLCFMLALLFVFTAGAADVIIEGEIVAAQDEQPASEPEPVQVEAYVEADEEDYVVENPDEEQSLDTLEADQDALDAVNGMMNILLLGIDARPGEKTGRSDTMILLTLDADHNCIKMTSFMRDLYVEIPGRKNNRLNAAYVFGGPDLLMRTLEANFGVEVDHYVAVNFSVLGDVIDQLGGLVIDVPEKYLPRINAVIYQDNLVLGIDEDDGYIQLPGEQLLTGKQAQAYARYRYGTPDGDFGRTVRQREVILKCMDK
ncbi:MAG: LCP family protein, partial [Clostridia bacterium]|nr:LCP family protein [Clostridia bacterium]